MMNRTPVFQCRTIPALAKLMKSCGTCVNCYGDNDNLVAIGDAQPPSIYSIECIHCDYMGAWDVSLERAVKAWRSGRR